MSGEKNKNGMAGKIGILLAILALCGGVAYADPRMLHKNQPGNAPAQESESLTLIMTEEVSSEEVSTNIEETETEKVVVLEMEEATILVKEYA